MHPHLVLQDLSWLPQEGISPDQRTTILLSVAPVVKSLRRLSNHFQEKSVSQCFPTQCGKSTATHNAVGANVVPQQRRLWDEGWEARGAETGRTVAMLLHQFCTVLGAGSASSPDKSTQISL